MRSFLLLAVVASCIWTNHAALQQRNHVIYVEWNREAWGPPANRTIEQALEEFPCRTLREGPQGDIRLILNSDFVRACGNRSAILNEDTTAGAAWDCGNNHVDITIQRAAKDWDSDKLRVLLWHEIGHAVGLDHVNRLDSIMHPQVLAIRKPGMGFSRYEKDLLCHRVKI